MPEHRELPDAMPRLALLVQPYIRWELPGWYRLYRALGGGDERAWAGAPDRELHSKFHGYTVPVRLSNWSDRLSWFLGRYYELETQLLLRAALRPGDTFVDVGANVGMLTLLAAWLVRPGGRVHAIEPNPVPAERLERALASNRIDHVHLARVGLADAPGELELAVVGTHTGAGSFAAVPEAELPLVSAVHRVPVVRGDDLLPRDDPSPLLVKIDVEGFECRVLAGLERTLRERRPAVVVEAIPEQLERAGASADELFAILRGHGLVGHRMRPRRKGLRHVLVLEPVRSARDHLSTELVWLHPDGLHSRRLRTAPDAPTGQAGPSERDAAPRPS